MSSDYRETILALDYSMFSNLTKTLVFRDDCVVALNPQNSEHQQSNFCFRIRLQKVEDLEKLVNETKPLFDRVNVVPRYFIDELCGVSLNQVQDELARLNVKADIDTDLIMSWTGEKRVGESVIKEKGVRIKEAQLEDLQDLVRVFGAANDNYGDNLEWLEKKIGYQLKNQDIYTVFKVELVDTGELVSAVILNEPPGLAGIGHVNAVATHPSHQRKGYAGDVLKYAVELKGGRFYLEVYDDLYHAHRLYEKIGFRKEGTLKTISFALVV